MALKDSNSSVVNRILAPFNRFAAIESASGLVLIGCAVVALIWANSPWGATYGSLWHMPIKLGVRDLSIDMSLQHWVNDALMVIFFFLVGLEIKRELLIGELASIRSALLPIVAAIGGIVVPAAIYSVINRGGPGADGWGIPMATDIAFSLAVLGLLGSRVPLGLKVFLTALAIVDDLGAVLVIALFYTAEISLSPLLLSFGAVLLSYLGGRFGMRSPWFYLLLGIVAWYGMLNSGVHATIAGVLMALTIPVRVLGNFEHALHKPVAFLIMPLFALANSGVDIFGGLERVEGAMQVAFGVIAGLMLGKSIGITLFSFVAVKFGIAALPSSTNWKSIYGVAWIAGIGFTMSLFVGGLAFGSGALLDWAKIGIFAASLASGFIGWAILKKHL